MNIFGSKVQLDQFLQQIRQQGKTIALVPTMGALHPGHLSLLANAKRVADMVVCSIFVNPTQFNDPKDLELYPRPIETDIAMLEEAGCDVLFNPEVAEMYTPGETWHLDIGYLEHILEGKYRPGHYQGVTQVVSKLFNIVKPHIGLFGQKDFQQFLVIDKMVQLLGINIELIMCPIVREDSGLAMSSRNKRLTDTDKQLGLNLYQALTFTKQAYGKLATDELKQQAIAILTQSAEIKLDYFEVLDAATLLEISAQTKSVVALVAAYVGSVRLIDNIMLS